MGNRIGDKVTLVGVKFTMMFELNERYSDVTFRLMVVRSVKGDTPTAATLWQGDTPTAAPPLGRHPNSCYTLAGCFRKQNVGTLLNSTY